MRTMAILATAVALSIAAGAGPAAGCGFTYGVGWTATGGGTAGQLIVLGSETCTGSVRGDSLRIIAPPRHGKIKVTGPSSYVYTPTRGYRGPDTFNVSAIAAGVGLVIGTIDITIQ